MQIFAFKSSIEMFPAPILGVVEEAIAPNQPGRVKALASSWPARLSRTDRQVTLTPGQQVEIVAMQGIVLLVQPWRDRV